MHRLNFRRSVAPLAVAVGALALAACSDSPVSPTRSLRSSEPTLSVTSGPGANQKTIVSDGSTQYCASAQLNGGNNAVGDWTIPTTFAPVAGCGTALDLQLPAGTSPLDVYNPGWSAPFAGSHWIGITTKGGPSSDYRPNPGRYVFQETFSVPAGVTNPTLDLHVKGDNVAAVYLNTTQLGAQPNTDCNAGTCNWNSDLHLTSNLTASASYTLTFVVSDLPTGFPSAVAGVGGSPPQYGCSRAASDGVVGFTAAVSLTRPNHIVHVTESPLVFGGAGTLMTNIGMANQAGCENPMGLDFAGTINWTVPTPPPVVALFVIGDVEPHAIGNNVNFWGAQWWKNNDMSGVVSNGVASFKGYATLSDNVCGGTWQSLPGNSSNPPDVIPTNVAIIVTSTVLKNGNNISGDIKQIVIVHSDGGYGPNPGHRGNGPVTSIVCTAP